MRGVSWLAVPGVGGCRTWSAAWCAAALSCLLCCANALATPLGRIAEYPLTYPDAPFDITAGPDGDMWFTNQ